MEPPQTDVTVPIVGYGLEFIESPDGGSKVVRHFLLRDAETRSETPGGHPTTESRSWHDSWVWVGRGCSNAPTCLECREEMRRRNAFRRPLRAVS